MNTCEHTAELSESSRCHSGKKEAGELAFVLNVRLQRSDIDITIHTFIATFGFCNGAARTWYHSVKFSSVILLLISMFECFHSFVLLYSIGILIPD